VNRIGGAGADLPVRALLNAINAAESIPEWMSDSDWNIHRKSENG
jgi:hypothetical protein